MNIINNKKVLCPVRTSFSKGNDALRNGKYTEAITYYEEAMISANPSLKKMIRTNIDLAKKKIGCETNTSILSDFSATSETELTCTPENNFLTISPQFSQSDSHLKIAVVLHAFHLDCLTTLIDKISNISAKYDLFITVSRDKKQNVEEILSSGGVTGKIVEVANLGYDILPFIQCLPVLIEEEYDLVCKLHTKKGLANLEDQFPDAGNVWSDMLVNPILGSSEAVRQILATFCQHKDIGMIGSADLYTSTRALMYGNETHVTSLLQSLSPHTDPACDWGFFAGSIFWSRVSVLKPLLAILPVLEAVTRSECLTGATQSVWHAAERINGILPEVSAKEIAIAYSLDTLGEQVRILPARNSNIPRGSKYGIGAHIEGFIKLNENSQFLKTNSNFDYHFYSKHYGEVENAGFEVIYHYLRYGVYERCNPNPDFSSAYYWEENRDVANNRLNPFIHYLQYGEKEGRSVFPAEENTERYFHNIKEIGLFDPEYYLKENSDVACSKIPPLQHYIQFGWKEKRQPSPVYIFDSFWYVEEYLRHWRYPINPLIHYAVCGAARKLLPTPGVPQLNECGTQSLAMAAPKRICLFAGYDAQGLIDDYVIDFISELQKYSDVYYLADGSLQPGELEKLEGLTKGAWAFRHGEYDFGSYSRLARNLVGWQHIRDYDELLLVNDSNYLLGSLEGVFSKMKRKKCDWWGLQATKGISATRDTPSNQYSTKIPIDVVLEKMLPDFEADECYDFLIGSYFLAFRRQVFEEGGELQLLLNGVEKERSKKDIILRYEIGLTRRLLHEGFKPATFIDDLYPFHPIYSRQHFDLIREGFPLFKRFLLTENHYRVPELWRWKQWIYEILPSADLRSAEDNLYRIANAEKLYNSLNIPDSPGEWPQKVLSDEEFVIEDANSTISDFCWAFPVCGYDHQLGLNERMVFEHVKENPMIRKIILTRSKCVKLKGANVEIIPLKSLAGQRALMNARYIFLKHSPKVNVIYPLDTQRHRFINLWHGIPLKRIGFASIDLQDKLEVIKEEHAKCHAVIASSPVDRLAMTAAFYPLNFHNIWVTGLPRNDVIMRKESLLPKDFRVQLDRLRNYLQGRRLVLFAPTFRNAQADGYYSFSDIESQALSECLLANNAVLGIREHMADRAHSYSADLIRLDQPFISLDRIYYPDIELLYREASCLITDYSSCFIDFMLTGKPEICFAYDIDAYSERERGLFYNIEDVFPGQICRDFSGLLRELKATLSGNCGGEEIAYRFKRNLFFSHSDENNTRRLIKKIAGEYESVECDNNGDF